MASALMERRNRTERLQQRVTTNQKETLVRAAQLKGMDVSEFVILHAYEAAVEVVRDEKLIYLNSQETERFVQSFFDPPAPSENLRRLMQEED